MILTAQHVTSSRLISALCTFKPFFLHNRIYQNRKIFFRVSWLSNYDIHRQHRIYMPFFFLTFYRIFKRRQFKDATRSDCTQRRAPLYRRKHSTASGMFSEILFFDHFKNMCKFPIMLNDIFSYWHYFACY